MSELASEPLGGSDVLDMSRRVVVGGIGNIFLGDDGFGVEVARRLAERTLPPEAKVIDVGIRGLHLAFDLFDGCDTLILVDALPTGDAPGTLVVLEPDVGGDDDAPPLDAHSLNPLAVLAISPTTGSSVPKTANEGASLEPQRRWRWVPAGPSSTT